MNNKKMYKGLLLATGVLTTMLLSSGQQYLAADGGELTSNGSIKFTVDTDGQLPVDPETPDPEKPVEPIDPTEPDGQPGPGTQGPLSIDFASSFSFGDQKVSTVTKNYKAAPQKLSGGESRANYVQVSDKRGTFAGWSLSVTQNEEFTSEDDDELTGAQLSFSNLEMKSNLSQDVAPSISYVEDTPLVVGAEMGLVSAVQDFGMGTWVLAFGDTAKAGESVNLMVPGTTVQMTKEYRTTLTWTLSDVPTNL